MENFGINSLRNLEKKKLERQVEKIVERQIKLSFSGGNETNPYVISAQNYAFLAGMKAGFSILKGMGPEAESAKILKAVEKYLQFYPIYTKK